MLKSSPTQVTFSQTVGFRVVTSRSDIPAIISLSRSAHEESRFRHIRFSPEKVEKIVLSALKNENRRAFMLAIKADEAIGFAYCSVGEYHIGVETLLTTIHGIFVTNDVRAGLRGGRVALGLFKGIETWSKARGVEEILLHVTSDVDLARAHKLAKRIGYKFIGGSYAYSISKE